MSTSLTLSLASLETYCIDNSTILHIQYVPFRRICLTIAIYLLRQLGGARFFFFPPRKCCFERCQHYYNKYGAHNDYHTENCVCSNVKLSPVPLQIFSILRRMYTERFWDMTMLYVYYVQNSKYPMNFGGVNYEVVLVRNLAA